MDFPWTGIASPNDSMVNNTFSNAALHFSLAHKVASNEGNHQKSMIG
jgi:hypothetical protein